MRRRLVASHVALVGVTLIALEVPMGVLYAASARAEFISELDREAQIIAGLSEDFLSQPGASRAQLQTVATTYGADVSRRAVIVDDQDRMLADSFVNAQDREVVATRPELQQALTSRERSVTTVFSPTLRERVQVVAVPIRSASRVEPLGAVRVSEPIAPVERRIRNVWLVLALGAVLMLGVAAGLAMRLLRWITHPIDQLRSVAAGIRRGDLTLRADTERGPHELRELGEVLNDAAERTRRTLSSQRDFVADASHELRTPLTALRLRLEVLAMDVPEPAAEQVRNAVAETTRLGRLIEDLLAVARAESGRATSPGQRVPLGPLLLERSTCWRALATPYDVSVAVEAGTPLAAHADPDRVGRILDNLVSNALQVSPPGGVVRVFAQSVTDLAGDAVELHVLDEGPGLAPAERDRAFERYWRGSGGTGAGSGIGLALVRRLAEASGGSASLRPASSGGLDAVVRLPAASALVSAGHDDGRA